MKNNDVNRNIIRAISIGIAATLAIMPSTTAFASDGEREGGRSRRHRSEEGSSRHHRHSDRSERVREARDEVSRAADEAENYSSEHHEESSNYQAPAPDFSAPAPDFSAPAPEAAVPAADVSAPAPDFSTPAPEASAPAADVSAPAPVFSAPVADAATPAADIAAPAAPAADASAPAADTNAPAPEAAAPSAEAPAAPSAEAPASRSESPAPASESGEENSKYDILAAKTNTGSKSAPSNAQDKAEDAAKGAEKVADDSTNSTPHANEIKDDLNDAAKKLDNVIADSEDHDQKTEKADELVNDTNDYVDKHLVDPTAGSSVEGAEKKTEAAGSAVDDAVDISNKDAGTSNTIKDNVNDAAYNKLYDTQEDSDNARNDAREELAVIGQSLEESKEAVENAQEKLDAADQNLKAAETAMNTALEKKKAADKAADEAEKAYIKLLNDLGEQGVVWDYDEDGKIAIKDGVNVTDDQEMAAAIEKTAAAYEKARTDAENAATDVGNELDRLAATASDIVNNANGLVSTLIGNDNSKAGSYIRTNENGDYLYEKDENGDYVINTNTDLDTLLSNIKKISGQIDGTIAKEEGDKDKTYTEFVHDLIENMIKYDLLYKNSTADGFKISWNANPNSSSTLYYYVEAAEGAAGGYVRDENGNFVKAGKGQTGTYDQIKISFNYSSVLKYGDLADKNDYAAGSHILVQDLTNKKMIASEQGILSGMDAYQRDLTTARQTLKNADTLIQSASKYLESIAKVDEAVTGTAGKRIAAADGQITHYSGLADGLDKDIDTQKARNNQTLVNQINAQRSVLSDPDFATKYTGNNRYIEGRKLAALLLEYKIRQEYNDVSNVFFDPTKWKGTNADTRKGYMSFDYVDDEGNTKKGEIYFGYDGMYDNGETVNYSGANYNSITKYGNGSISHIDVKINTESSTVKLDAHFTDSDFDKIVDNNDKALKALQNEQSNYRSAAGYADYLKKQAIADELKEKVGNAKEAVNTAAEELRNARKSIIVNAELIEQLQTRLENAREDYKTAKEELKVAEKNLETIEKAYASVETAVNDYVNAFKVKATEADTPEDPDEPGARPGGTGGGTGGGNGGGGNGGGGTGGGAGGGGGDATGPATPAAPSVASAVTPAPTFFADAPAGGVLGDISAPTITGVFTGGVPGAGAIDTGTPAAGDIEAGALMEEGMPEGGVLGERLAPIAPFVEDVENGTFSRGKLFTEEGLKLSFAWWLIIFLLGAKGVMMILDKNSRKKNPDA